MPVLHGTPRPIKTDKCCSLGLRSALVPLQPGTHNGNAGCCLQSHCHPAEGEGTKVNSNATKLSYCVFVAFLLVKYSLVAVNISVFWWGFCWQFSPRFFNDSGHGQPPGFPSSACVNLLRLLEENTTDCVASISEKFCAQFRGLEVLRCHQGWCLVMLLLLLPHCILLGLFSCTQRRRKSSLVSVFLWRHQSNQIRAPSCGLMWP